MSENQNQNELESLKMETQQPVSQKVQEKKQPKQNPISEEIYNEFIDLWFTRYDGGKLKENFAKRLELLEKEVKTFTGYKSIRSVSAAIGSNIIRLIEGVPVPDSVYKTIKEAGNSVYYFGK